MPQLGHTLDNQLILPDICPKNIARVRNCSDITIWNSLFGLLVDLSFCLFCLFKVAVTELNCCDWSNELNGNDPSLWSKCDPLQ